MWGFRSLPVALVMAALAAGACLLNGCGHASKQQLTRSDLLALRSIYQTSSGTLRRPQIDVHVLRGGTVNLQVEGYLAPKPDGEGDAWIPLLLLHQLPAYFHVEPADAASPVTVEAYQFDGGVWCIAAVIPEPERASPAMSSGTGDTSSGNAAGADDAGEGEAGQQQQSADDKSLAGRTLTMRPGELAQLAPPPQRNVREGAPLNFQVTLASPEYRRGLPFAVLTDPGGEATSLSVDLPSGAKFANDTSKVEASVVQGWQGGAVLSALASLRTSEGVTSQNLSPIFDTLAGRPKRAATLNLVDAVAWDLSTVRFHQPSLLSEFRAWFLPAAVALVLLACGLWLRFYELAPLAAGIHDLVSAMTDEARELEEWFERYPNGRTIEGSWGEWGRLETSLLQSLTKIRTGVWRRSVDPVGAGMLNRLAQRLDQFDRGIQVAMKTEPPMPDESEFDRLSMRLATLRETANLLAREYDRYRMARAALWMVGLGILVCLLLLLASFAKAQSGLAHVSNRQLSLPLLGDLDVTLAPHDLTKLGEKFDVAVRFAPLTGDSHQGDSMVRFGTADAPGVTIDPVAPPANPKLSIVQQSQTQITLKVPMHYTPLVRRINAISEWTEQFRVPEGYNRTIDAANHVNFSYTLQGASKPHLVSSAGRHWLYLFPFDSADVEIPLDMEQAALLFHLGLTRPANDYFATVTMDGAALDLAESENGDHYDFVNADTASRIPLSAHRPLVLHAKFQRSASQRWGLTWGMALMAIVVGIGGGWFTKLPDKDWKGYLYTTLGLGTLVFGVRAAVLATYKDLPTLMTGEGTTIFELVYVGCVVLMVVTVVVTRRALKP